MKRATSAALVALVAAFAQPGVAADYTLKVSSPTNNDSILKWMQGFEQRLEESSEGAIDVQLYPANQLGQIPATVEGIAMGTLEVTAPASGFFVQLDERFEVLSVPGLFSDMAHAQRVLADDAVLDRLSQYANDQGVETIAAFPHGRLALVSTKAVNTISDLEGQRIRVAGPTTLNTGPFKRLDASPLSMPLGEVLPAMQNGVVDGMIAGIPVFVLGRYYDVADTMTVLPESYLVVTAVASQAFLETIGEDLADQVRVAAREALPEMNAWNLGMTARMEGLWEDNGGTVVTLSGEDAATYLDVISAVTIEATNENATLEPELDFLRAAAARHADQ